MKKIIAGVLALSVALSLASCSSTSSSSKSRKNKKDKPERTTVEETLEEITEESVEETSVISTAMETEPVEETEATVATSEETEATEETEVAVETSETTETTEATEVTTMPDTEIIPDSMIYELDSNPFVGTYSEIVGMDNFNVYVTNFGLYADYSFYRIASDERGLVDITSDTTLLIDFETVIMTFTDNLDGTYTLEIIESDSDFLPAGRTIDMTKDVSYGTDNDGISEAIGYALYTFTQAGIEDYEVMTSFNYGYLDVVYYIHYEDENYINLMSFIFDENGEFMLVKRFGAGISADCPLDMTFEEAVVNIDYPYNLMTVDDMLNANG